MALIHHSSAVIFREINHEAVNYHYQSLQPLVTRDAYFNAFKGYAPTIPDSLDLEKPPRPAFTLRKAMEVAERLCAKIVDRIRAKNKRIGKNNKRRQTRSLKNKLQWSAQRSCWTTSSMRRCLRSWPRGMGTCSMIQVTLKFKKMSRQKHPSCVHCFEIGQNNKKWFLPQWRLGAKSESKSKEEAKEERKRNMQRKEKRQQQQIASEGRTRFGSNHLHLSQRTSPVHPQAKLKGSWRASQQNWNPHQNLNGWVWKQKANAAWWKRAQQGRPNDNRGVGSGADQANQWASWTRRRNQRQSFS